MVLLQTFFEDTNETLGDLLETVRRELEEVSVLVELLLQSALLCSRAVFVTVCGRVP